MKTTLQISERDNVVVALRALDRGSVIEGGVTVRDDVPFGHKLAISEIAAGAPIFKFGYPIGIARTAIAPGEHVHAHNLASVLHDDVDVRSLPERLLELPKPARSSSFDGYRRPDGRVGIRNEIWIVNTVGCVNNAAERIAAGASAELEARGGSHIDGVYAFKHPYGCSQLGHDLGHTQRILAGLARHPNAAAVLVLGLGCENNQLAGLLDQVGSAAAERIRAFNAQDVSDEVEEGLRRVAELAAFADHFERRPIPAAELVLGVKCGGSDGLSGITANPLVGRISNRLAAEGGTVLLTEVPEMFGAEDVLFERARDATVAGSLREMVNDFRAYFRRYGQPIDLNPAPGNKAGGITTLAEKSLGCVQKAGLAPIERILAYGESAPSRLAGAALINAPGNDGVSSTALVAAGAHLILFTTGRGTPLGFPAPTLKISTNSELAARKPSWIDFDAGPLADGTSDYEELSDRLFELVLDVASGRARTKSEIHGFREIAIWKDGVTL
jgi:altronate hydrolase